jgi:hypothetical protein
LFVNEDLCVPLVVDEIAMAIRRDAVAVVARAVDVSRDGRRCVCVLRARCDCRRAGIRSDGEVCARSIRGELVLNTVSDGVEQGSKPLSHLTP